ncbi:glycosyltransferase [Actinomycetospora succinea]|nr:glycosyltransferase [Actinomycetospora succinea]
MTRPILWTYVPQAEVLTTVLRPRAVIYHCVDDIAEQKGVDGDAFRRAEDRFVPIADVVLASAPNLAERLREHHDRVVHVPNVADTALFATARSAGPTDEALAELPHPRVVFVGAVVATKLDVELIVAMARARREWTIVLVGPVGLGDPSTDVGALRAEPNVRLVGARPHQVLPEVLRGADIGVIPYALNPLTASISPMKVYEYLAAGLPVVATPLPSLAGLEDVTVAHGDEGFVAAVERELRQDDESARSARSVRAADHSWTRRMTELEEILEEIEGAGARRTVLATPTTPNVSSGAGRRTTGIIRALAAQGIVDVVYQDTRGGEPVLFRDLPTVRLHPVRPSRGPRRVAAYLAARGQGVPKGFARGVWPGLAARVDALDDGRCRVVADGPVAMAALARTARRRDTVYNAHNVESSFRHLIGDPDVGSRRALEAFERAALVRSAQSWLVSEADMKSAWSLAPGARLLRVPNVVEAGHTTSHPTSVSPTVVFVGDATYEPNRRAVHLLLGEIAPALERLVPAATVIVVGRGTCDVDLAPPPNVELRGFVEDLDQLYANASCAVVPLTEGGGSPLKFLEALAHGVPVVATSRAAVGLDGLVPGEHFLEAEPKGDAFAEAVREALEPAIALRLARAGREIVDREYSVQALSRVLA